uniref:hypothetical protein n=1 Tax=uncultured Caulobacter sp. TaxID=158749 RepID=UPI0025CCAC78|nr:hypothetical protein [uncultured Caulobacter sp.]
MFERLPLAKSDSLMELAALMQADPRADKIDLGEGAYRDEGGDIPIMAAVKAPERLLVERRTSKGYLGPVGDAVFAPRRQDAFFPGLQSALFGRINVAGVSGSNFERFAEAFGDIDAPALPA